LNFRVKKEEPSHVKIFGTDLSDLFNATNERGKTVGDDLALFCFVANDPGACSIKLFTAVI
jgi:hypothetical protein